ncbi:sushi, von Willebrand factor type A, EGF and pentraxin domain-containing protein 1-like, partial [Dendronephthya gigantea]|uniref:sushi, von Willebrand factor type A, EGF and pentraxin domain-containing protein 1-like n=1 Tax=Dendronephthya gigantea TaxID=151771 RepID=UPI00106B21AF
MHIQMLGGYRLVGSGVKVCRVDKTWTGEDTNCEVVTCPPLNSLDLATVNDVNCIKKSLKFDSACIFKCPDGYEFNATRSQSSTRYCQVDGTWDGATQVCIDVKPPSFTTCPSNRVFFYNTTFRTNTAEVEWQVPEYEDNSILNDVNHKVTLEEVSDYSSPTKFTIGKHNIHYIVTDKAGLKAHCEFSIEVQDKEAPYYSNCSQKIEKEFIATPPYADKMRVSWEDPVFQDNSGMNPTVIPSTPNGALFKEGQHQITYTATDPSNNRNVSCTFEIHLKIPTCELQKRPKNGALVCLTIPSYQCQPLCKEGYDFGYKPQDLYYCVNRVWHYWPPFPPFQPTVWPDCARREDPNSGTLKMSSSYYFKGDCNDLEVQADLKERFITVVSDPMKFLRSFCESNKNCKV